MSLFYKIQQSPMCCGLRHFGRFRKANDQYSSYSTLTGKELDSYSFGQAEFCDDPKTLAENHQAYDELYDKFLLVHQTKPYTNQNHSAVVKNKVFLCIYRRKTAVNKHLGKEYNWPLDG